jgi:peptidoglycan/LPS O-acetylase OafA/YrhL
MSPLEDEEQHSVLLEKYNQEATTSSSSSSPSPGREKMHGFELQYPKIPGRFQDIYVGISASRLTSILSALAPSFLQPPQEGTPKPRLHPTSYLDGLRGVAAFIVWIHHVTNIYFPILTYGYNSGPNTTHFFQLPFLRIIYSGRGMVTVFFVISGYVLSYKSLKQIRKKEFAQLLDTLASAAFRRWLRLFLPLALATFLCMLVFWLGWYIESPTMPKLQASFAGQLWDWWQHFIWLSNPTMSIGGNDVYYEPYGSQLWTIPREMRGSLAIYLTLLGVAKTGQAVRLTIFSGLIWYYFWIGQWDLGLFLSGMILADVQLMTEEPAWGTAMFSLSRFVPGWALRHKLKLQHGTTILMTLVAIHFLCFPDEAANKTPGYGYLHAYTPAAYRNVNLTQRYWLCIGAILLVTAICFSPAVGFFNPTPLLQKPFLIYFSQYLANISYALYVTHMLILSTVGIRIFNFWKGKTQTEFVFGCIEGILVDFFLCFWLADLFWRGVDAKSVQVAKWVAEKCFVKA